MSAEAIILLVTGVIGFIASLVVTTAVTVIYINDALSKNRQLFYIAMKELGDSIIQKLEYHEEHDDKRFETRDKRIWALEMWKATVTRQVPVEFAGDHEEH